MRTEAAAWDKGADTKEVWVKVPVRTNAREEVCDRDKGAEKEEVLVKMPVRTNVREEVSDRAKGVDAACRTVNPMTSDKH